MAFSCEIVMTTAARHSKIPAEDEGVSISELVSVRLNVQSIARANTLTVVRFLMWKQV